MNQKNKKLGESIEFIFSNSNIMVDYVFKKDNKIKDNEIFEEFKKKDEQFKKEKDEQSKKEKDEEFKKKNEGF